MADHTILFETTLTLKVHSQSHKYPLDTVSFDVPLAGTSVSVTFSLKDETIFANYEHGVSQPVFGMLLSSGKDASNMTTTEWDSFYDAIDIGVRAIRRVLRWIQYYLNHGLLDIVGSSTFVTVDQIKVEVPPRNEIVGGMIHEYPLNETAQSIIQGHLGLEDEPFIAFRHLANAKKAETPRHSWIDATIAAELGIKEFLIRKYPKFETYLMEVPSPPLHKLYGSVLESLAEQKSPVLKKIREGVEIRNKLIHRPYDLSIGHQQARDYVDAIEHALFHLLYLLNPDDPVANRLGIHRQVGMVAVRRHT